MLYHAHPAEEVLAELHTSEKGLHQIYAEGRLRSAGRNTIRLTRKSLGHHLIEPFTNPVSFTLLVALLFSILTSQIAVSITLGCIVAVYALMRYAQSYSLEHTMRISEHHTTAPATVIRDGIEATIDSALVVPGDIIILRPGYHIPADGRIIHSTALSINQLALTGDTVPVPKRAKTLLESTPLEEQLNMVFRGSFVASGVGTYVATATGNATQYGHLSNSHAKVEAEGTLQRKINILLRRVTMVAFGLSLAVLALSLYREEDLTQAVHYFVAILIAAAPIVLPIAIGLLVSIGLRRAAKQHALLTSIRSAEAAATTSVILSDKTGILTHDTLLLKEYWQPEHVTQKLATALDRALLRADTDAHDIAFRNFLKRQHISPSSHKPAASFAFAREQGMSGNLWHHGAEYILQVKGTPEKILHHANLTSQEYEQAHRQLHQLTSQGYHVLALAHTTVPTAIAKLSSLPKRTSFEFDGLVALQDHLRPDATTALTQASQAGIRVCMVTGDHVETAYRTGLRLGLISSRQEVFDCRKLNVINDSQLGRICRNTTVFARATPKQKQRILGVFKRHHIVAMTGDSIDDVVVLTRAHLGITTKQSSRIAREASDLLLLDNTFATSLQAIRHSRTILGNIRRVVFYTLITSLSELGIVISSLLLGMPGALLPSQLLWINLVIAACIVLPLGLEPHSRNIMRRKPVAPGAPILPNYLIARALLIAASMIFVGIGAFTFAYLQHGIEYARSLTFFALVLMQLTTALIARSDHTSTLVRFRTWSPLIYIGTLAAVISLTVVFWTPLAGAFTLVALHGEDTLRVGVLAVLTPLLVGEVLKLYSRHTVRKKGESY